MEEQEIIPSPEFLKGYNEGYTLSKYVPDLAEKLSNALPDTERGVGFKEGKEQSEYEKNKERLPNWMRHYRDDKDLDVPDNEDYNKDDFEPEKG